MCESDVIGGFPFSEPNCRGCGEPLSLENAWLADGCPCNSDLGVNSMNETRWRLLMQLQQGQSLERERLMLFAKNVQTSVEDWHPVTVRFELLAAIHDLNGCGSDDDPR